jgi:hypothetical protein
VRPCVQALVLQKQTKKEKLKKKKKEEDETGEHHLKWPGSEGQKSHALARMWNRDLVQIQQYYETQITHKREGKRRKLRR